MIVRLSLDSSGVPDKPACDLSTFRRVFRRGAMIFRTKLLAERPIRPTMLGMELSNAESMPVHAGRVRVMLLDSHILFQESLSRLLASEQDVELVAACTTPAEALKSLKRSGADVILLDIDVAKEFISCARKTRHPGKYLVLAREVDAAASAQVLKYGASGIFLESDSPARLVQAIRLVAGGEAWVDQKVVQFLAERYPRFETRWQGKLSEREQDVLRGVVDGLSNRSIGNQIGVSESTIKAALQQLFKKAGVRTRSQLVRIAIEGESPASRAIVANSSDVLG
jgi:two-component system, NarL family, nitrate/nitrite response regulator NarL